MTIIRHVPKPNWDGSVRRSEETVNVRLYCWLCRGARRHFGSDPSRLVGQVNQILRPAPSKPGSIRCVSRRLENLIHLPHKGPSVSQKRSHWEETSTSWRSFLSLCDPAAASAVSTGEIASASAFARSLPMVRPPGLRPLLALLSSAGDKHPCRSSQDGNERRRGFIGQVSPRPK